MPKLSVVIAAYNEEARLPKTLQRMVSFLERNGISYEFILVNDGSKDRTLDFLKREAAQNPHIKYLSHFPNHGRGASIREGVLAASGDLILETDADGSVDDSAILKLLAFYETHPEVDAVFGSREFPESKIPVRQPFLREFLGYGFLYLAKIMLASPFTTDFTLGFKSFRNKAAKDIFARQFDNHYVAEAEIVFISKRRGWRVMELPVIWSDNRDSRVRPFRDSFRSFRGMLQILWRAFKGKYH